MFFFFFLSIIRDLRELPKVETNCLLLLATSDILPSTTPTTPTSPLPPRYHTTTLPHQDAFHRKLQLSSLPGTSPQGPSTSSAEINSPIPDDRDDPGTHPGLAGNCAHDLGRAFPSAWNMK